MRLGLIGLGRIGAFHTNTLVGIPAIDSLVVTDLVPEKTKTVVERFGAQGVEGADSVDALLGTGVDGVIIAAGTPEDFPAYYAQETAKWSEIIRTRGIKIQN